MENPIYIPDDLFEDELNKERIYNLVDNYQPTDLFVPGEQEKEREKMLLEIERLGERKVLHYLQKTI